MAFRKAVKEKIKVKLLLAGSSGSGKTYSALRLAQGIANKEGGRIAVIDTEQSRSCYYSQNFDFDVMDLTEFSPESYISAIDEAVKAKEYSVLVIDSTTQEWDYLLDIHNKMPGNSFTNWAKLTPRHDAFVRKILETPMHIICTVRGKDEYVLEEKDGKQMPKKVGMGYKQRGGMEYEYTVTFNLAQDTHVADATKDNTGIFDGKYEVLTESHGEKLWQWANDGATPTEKPKQSAPTPTPASETDSLSTIHADIIAECTRLGGTKNAELMTKLKEYTTNGNPKQIKDVAKATELLEALKGMKGE